MLLKLRYVVPFIAWCALQLGHPTELMARGDSRSRSACSNSDPATKVRVWEQRSPQRFDEDLLFTDGLDYQRDIGVYICGGVPSSEYAVRAWVRPKDGQWREIRIGDMTQMDRTVAADVYGKDPDTVSFLPGILRVEAKEPPPGLTVPIRREGLSVGDSVRVQVQTDCKVDTHSVKCEVEVINDFLTIDRYGLLPGFSDSILFVKRLGVNPKAAPGQFDYVNYRPAPGFSYGLTYLHRKHAFLQFLEPGFGFNVSLVSWNDASLDSAGQLVKVTNNDPIQVTIGAMGSMFDNVITVVYGGTRMSLLTEHSWGWDLA